MGRASKLLKILAFALVLLVSLIVLASAIISYSSRKDWAAEKAKLLAKGEKLSFAELVPEAHMDERNFFFDPIWLELIDTKPVSSSSRIELAEPKVPKGQRQLDQIDGEIPVELRERISPLLPDSEKRNEKLTVSDLEGFAHRELMFVQPAERRRELSRLILEAVSGSEALRGRIGELLLRPEAVIPYDPAWGIANPRDASDYVYRVGRLYSLIALAHYCADDHRAAAGEIRNLLLYAGVFRSDPFYYAVNARLGLVTMATSLITEGIRGHVWSDEELAEFEGMLRTLDFPADIARSFRAERGGANQLIEAMIKDERGRDIWKGGEGFQNLSFLERQIATWSFPLCIATDQARLNRLHQLIIEYCEKPNGKISDHLGKLGEIPFPWRGLHVPSISQESLWPSHIDFMMLYQDEISRTRIACALERYRLAKGKYPSDLGMLVPEFLPQLPQCVIPQRSFEWAEEKGVYHLKLTGGASDDLVFLENLN